MAAITKLALRVMTISANRLLNPSFRVLLQQPVLILAFGFGTGLAPKAPGTAGTLIGVLFYLLMQSLTLPVYLAVAVVIILLGIPICGVAAQRLGVHDHPGIVWDEIAGYLVTMTFAPAGWLWVLVGFLVFRLFDILKPWPISWLDRRIHGGLGIMLDDIVAGLFAGLLLWAGEFLMGL